MITRKHHQQRRRGRGEEQEAFFRKGVGVEETASKRLLAHRVLGGLIVPVERGKVEVGGGVVHCPICGVAAEEGVCDKRGKGKGQARVATCVVDALLVLLEGMVCG